MRLRVYYDPTAIRAGLLKDVSPMQPWVDVDCSVIRCLGADIIMLPSDRVAGVAHSFHTSIIDRIVDQP